jgi:hypothetical protein
VSEQPFDAEVREALASAAEHLVATLDGLTGVDLELPATDAWRVRELAAHAARGLQVVETVLDTPVDPSSPRLDTAADYYRAAFAVEGLHAGIEQRARDAAEAMGDDPAAFAREAVGRVLPRVAATPGATEVQHAVGRLLLSEYLRTRVLELVLHTVDLQLALGRPASAPPSAAAVTARLVLDLSDRADALAVACTLAGRAWPVRVDVLR